MFEVLSTSGVERIKAGRRELRVCARTRRVVILTTSDLPSDNTLVTSRDKGSIRPFCCAVKLPTRAVSIMRLRLTVTDRTTEYRISVDAIACSSTPFQLPTLWAVRHHWRRQMYDRIGALSTVRCFLERWSSLSNCSFCQDVLPFSAAACIFAPRPSSSGFLFQYVRCTLATRYSIGLSAAPCCSSTLLPTSSRRTAFSRQHRHGKSSWTEYNYCDRYTKDLPMQHFWPLKASTCILPATILQVYLRPSVDPSS
jgi:hypothetical protein